MASCGFRRVRHFHEKRPLTSSEKQATPAVSPALKYYSMCSMMPSCLALHRLDVVWLWVLKLQLSCCSSFVPYHLVPIHEHAACQNNEWTWAGCKGSTANDGQCCIALDRIEVYQHCGFQRMMGPYGIPGCSHYWRPTWQKVELVPGPSKALRRNNSMDFEPAMNENGVLDKFLLEVPLVATPVGHPTLTCTDCDPTASPWDPP